jgi:hypothetical protein
VIALASAGAAGYTGRMLNHSILLQGWRSLRE